MNDLSYPDTFLRIMQSDSGQNDTGYANPEYDRLIEQSFYEPDNDKRLDLLEQAEAVLMEDLPIVPIYCYVRAYRLDPRVKGWHPNPLSMRNYTQIYFEE